MRSWVRYPVVVIILVHGMLHLLGVVKGFGWSSVDTLHQPVSTAAAFGWLAACLLVVLAAILLARDARPWWAVATVAAVTSQVMVVTSWSDAWAGTVANVVLAAVAAYGWLNRGPYSFAAEYARRSATALGNLRGSTDGSPDVSPDASPDVATDVVTDGDLENLPRCVAGYVRASGAVGRPRVRSFRARIHGRIRSGPTAQWMRFTGEQVNVYGPDPTRLFHIDATMKGLPVDVLHVFTGGRATMRVRVASAFPTVDAAGEEMTRAEAVTLLNDMCVLAPAAMVDAGIAWEELEPQRVRATWTCARNTVSADLVFDIGNNLVDFVSDDRLRAAPDGRSFVRQRWSTPLQEYAELGGRRRVVLGDAVWDAPFPEGMFAYLEFHVDEVVDNPHLGRGSARFAPSGLAASRGLHPVGH